MAVLIEAISVVVRADELLKKFPGGWNAFKGIESAEYAIFCLEKRFGQQPSRFERKSR